MDIVFLFETFLNIASSYKRRTVFCGIVIKRPSQVKYGSLYSLFRRAPKWPAGERQNARSSDGKRRSRASAPERWKWQPSSAFYRLKADLTFLKFYFL